MSGSGYFNKSSDKTNCQGRLSNIKEEKEKLKAIRKVLVK